MSFCAMAQLSFDWDNESFSQNIVDAGKFVQNLRLLPNKSGRGASACKALVLISMIFIHSEKDLKFSIFAAFHMNV